MDRIAGSEYQTGQRDGDGWEILGLLLDAGAEVHALDLEGLTAIDMAMQSHRQDIVELLLSGRSNGH